MILKFITYYKVQYHCCTNCTWCTAACTFFLITKNLLLLLRVRLYNSSRPTVKTKFLFFILVKFCNQHWIIKVLLSIHAVSQTFSPPCFDHKITCNSKRRWRFQRPKNYCGVQRITRNHGPVVKRLHDVAARKREKKKKKQIKKEENKKNVSDDKWQDKNVLGTRRETQRQK